MDTKEIVFNIYRDEIIKGKEFKEKVERKFKLTQKEISDIYARINNYQIKTYGKRLDDTFEHATHEEMERVHHNARCRKKQRKYHYYENTKVYRKTDEI